MYMCANTCTCTCSVAVILRYMYFTCIYSRLSYNNKLNSNDVCTCMQDSSAIHCTCIFRPL